MILARCLLCFVGITHKTTFCWLPCWIIRSMFLSPGVLIFFKLHWGCLLINMSSFLLDTLIVCFQMSKVYLVSQFRLSCSSNADKSSCFLVKSPTLAKKSSKLLAEPVWKSQNQRTCLSESLIIRLVTPRHCWSPGIYSDMQLEWYLRRTAIAFMYFWYLFLDYCLDLVCMVQKWPARLVIWKISHSKLENSRHLRSIFVFTKKKSFLPVSIYIYIYT
jgi:hypothetical protein